MRLDDITKFAHRFTPHVQNDRARFVWDPIYAFAWMQEHGFYRWLERVHPSPVAKYRKVLKWLTDSDLRSFDFSRPEELEEHDFHRVHSPAYLKSLELLAKTPLGFVPYELMFGSGPTPVNPQLLDFYRTSCAGTYEAARLALQHGVAMNLSGGFHHAFRSSKEGFCVLNDVAIAIRKLRTEAKIRTAAIVDLDVHHGNGNAAIFQDDPRVNIFDIYQKDNYPGAVHMKLLGIPRFYEVEKRLGLHSAEDVGNRLYMDTLRNNLESFLIAHNPDIVFYLAGADPYEGDRLGGFKVSIEGMLDRDRHVLETTNKLGIPTTVVMAGGYAEKPNDVAYIHYKCAELVTKQ